MKQVIQWVMLGAGLAWGVPKGLELHREWKEKEAKREERVVVVKEVEKPPVAPGGPADRWLPRVRQLEEVLQQFTNTTSNAKR